MSKLSRELRDPACPGPGWGMTAMCDLNTFPEHVHMEKRTLGHLEKDFEEEVGNKRKHNSYAHGKCMACLPVDSVLRFSLLPPLFACAFPSLVSTLHSKHYNEPSGPDCSHL